MKRLLLAAVALAGTFGIAQANTVTVNNLTGCPYTLNFSSYAITIGPGVTLVTPPAGDPDLFVCKVIYNHGLPGSISIGVGLNPDYPSYATSAMYTNNPPCAPNGYSAAWTQTSATANAQLVIF